MKTTTKTLLAALMLLTISCKKESSNIQSSVTTDESNSQALSSGANELVGAYAVRIGTQVWKKKDLTTSYYRNGDKIPQVKDSAKWGALTTGAWCWYDDNPAMGKLYNWYAVHDPRGLAPVGWHVPSDAEWTTLTDYLGGESLAGGKMKETGTTHWLAPNTDATNSSGFTALPGGYRANLSSFFNIGYFGAWWSSTEYGTYARARELFYFNGLIDPFYTYKYYGFSVRCLRD